MIIDWRRLRGQKREAMWNPGLDPEQKKKTLMEYLVDFGY